MLVAACKKRTFLSALFFNFSAKKWNYDQNILSAKNV
jgi:hypothetical protein